MRQTKISCRPTHSLVGESETQKMYYFIYLDHDSNLSGFGRNLEI